MTKARDLADRVAFGLNAIALIREERTGNTMLDWSDAGKMIVVTSGTFTQTIDLAATLGNGWHVTLKNSGTGEITVSPSGAETIDDRANVIVYPGEERRVLCDSSNFYSTVLKPFGRLEFFSSGTFVKPTGYSKFGFHLIGGGGGGSRSNHTGNGSAGAGGTGFEIELDDSTVPVSSITVTVGSGGLGGSGPDFQNNVGTGGGSTTVSDGADFSLTAQGGGAGPGTGSSIGTAGGINILGIARAATDEESGSGSSIYGGGKGRISYNSVNYGHSALAGRGGGLTGFGSWGNDGVAPGGGGEWGSSAYNYGPNGGDGADGAAYIWGII